MRDSDEKFAMSSQEVRDSNAEFAQSARLVRDSENDAIQLQLLTDQQRAVIDLLHRQSHISTSDVIRSLGTRRRRAQDVLRELLNSA